MCCRGRRGWRPAWSRSWRMASASRSRPALDGRSSIQYRSAMPAISTSEPSYRPEPLRRAPGPRSPSCGLRTTGPECLAGLRCGSRSGSSSRSAVSCGCPGCVGLVTPPAELGHDPPARAGVQAQRHRPDQVALPDHRAGPSGKTGDLTSKDRPRGGVQGTWRRATLPVTAELVFEE
jgi:hypothetical protein